MDTVMAIGVDISHGYGRYVHLVLVGVADVGHILPMKNAIWIGMVFGLGTAGISGPVAQARAPGLEQVIESVRLSVGRGIRPYVVMDLDETVIDSRARRRLAYVEAARELCAAKTIPSVLCGTLAGLNTGEIYGLANAYDATELAHTLGIDLRTPDWSRIVNRMEELYLSGKYEGRDEPVPGADLYVRELRGVGARVVYVSSRFESAQLDSTLATLRAFGMLSDASDVLLRPAGMSSIDFKRWAFGRVKSQADANGAQILAAFENEPENLRAMQVAFGEAELIFVEGATFSSGPLPPKTWRIQNYR